SRKTTSTNTNAPAASMVTAPSVNPPTRRDNIAPRPAALSPGANRYGSAPGAFSMSQSVTPVLAASSHVAAPNLLLTTRSPGASERPSSLRPNRPPASTSDTDSASDTRTDAGCASAASPPSSMSPSGGSSGLTAGLPDPGSI